MDPCGNIYREELHDIIPSEDKARLDGYLIAKAEQGELERAKAKFKEALRKFEEEQESEA